MDNTQIMAPDGTWFLFADWQGVTRIALPGDKIKTDANLDRPHESKPLVLRPNGMVWSAYALDIDPVALKKVRPEPPGHDSPDPLGGPEISIEYGGVAVKVRGVSHKLASSGAALQLGGTPERHQGYAEMRHDVYPDGAVVVFGYVSSKVTAASGEVSDVFHPQVGLVIRTPEGEGQVAWCRPVMRVLGGSPDAFREGGRTWLADRDMVTNVGTLIEVTDAGEVVSEAQAPAVAGPWVLGGQVWWQPNDATLCVGARLGEAARSFMLAGEHAGPGRLLRLPGRVLFVPWHRGVVLDLAPAKRGKDELPRKHKAAEAPMYLAAERVLRPIREGMARRNIRVEWRGCTRHGKRFEPIVAISGRSDLVTYILAYALQDGVRAQLEGMGVSSVSVQGGTSYDEILAQTVATGEQDLRELLGMLDAAGISRAAGIGYLESLRKAARQRGKKLPLTPEAEAFACAAVLSGLRGEHGGAVGAVTPAAFASAATAIADHEALRKAGINGSQVAMFLTVNGHAELGAAAVEPTRKVLIAMNPTYANDLAEAIGEPAPPVVAVEEVVVTPSSEAARVIAALEGVLAGDFEVDPADSREGEGWYRFRVDAVPFQAGADNDVRVVATLCATDTDVAMDKLMTSLRAANKGLVGVRFEEADCYILARATCSLAEATAEKLTAMITGCRDAIASPAGQSLRAKWRTYD